MKHCMDYSNIELGRIYSYKDFYKCVLYLEKQYPAFLHKRSIGKTYHNREIPMLILGEGKKPLLFTGGVHGRENVNTMALLAMAEAYASGWEHGSKIWGVDIRKLFQEFRFYWIPLLNPDGYEISRKPGKEMWKGNGRGVDVNRNFPSIHWKSKTPFDYPASERETRALMRVINCIPALAYIDYHCRGKSIFYYRSSMNEAYNENQKRIGAILAKASGYSLEDPAKEIEAGDTGGNTVHYFSEIRKAPCFTIETVEERQGFPLPPILQEETFAELLATPIVLATAL